MPEGDSVFQLARRMQFLVGREVIRTQLRVPRYATVTFDGERIRRIAPMGKHLLVEIGERILHTHLKMDGVWTFHLQGDRWRRPGYTARVVLAVDGAPGPRPIEVVGHDLGVVEVFARRELGERLGHLGPDVLGDSWDRGGREEAIRRISAAPERPIGRALLDQRNLAGVGNEYRAEICFLLGVHPGTPAGKVDVPAAVDLARSLMWANRLSAIRATTGIRRRGERSYVFGRNHKPCRRCGALIRSGRLGGPDAGGEDGEPERIIWWCPHCQPFVA